jgi:hypothetical protein
MFERISEAAFPLICTIFFISYGKLIYAFFIYASIFKNITTT